MNERKEQQMGYESPTKEQRAGGQLSKSDVTRLKQAVRNDDGYELDDAQQAKVFACCSAFDLTSLELSELGNLCNALLDLRVTQSAQGAAQKKLDGIDRTIRRVAVVLDSKRQLSLA